MSISCSLQSSCGEGSRSFLLQVSPWKNAPSAPEELFAELIYEISEAEEPRMSYSRSVVHHSRFTTSFGA